MKLIDFETLIKNKWACDDYFTWLEFSTRYDFYHLKSFVSIYTRTYDYMAKQNFEMAKGADDCWKECVDLCCYYINKYPNLTQVKREDLLCDYHKEVLRTGLYWLKYEYIQESLVFLMNQQHSFKTKIYYRMLRNKFLFNIYIIYKRIKKIVLKK